MYKKILVPLDGSKLAEAPLDYAVWLCQKSAAELRLLHVDQDTVPSGIEYLAKTIEWVESHNTPGNARIIAKPENASGDPASEIIKYAEDNQIDLITMSTHGHTGLRRWLMGSVAEKVVRNSNRPVRLVKSFSNLPRKEGELAERTILVLIDGSELAEKILPYAAYHAGLSSGELILLSVCEPPDVMNPVIYHLTPDSYPLKRPVQWYKYVEQETKTRQQQCDLYLNRVADGLKEKGLKVRYQALLGEPAEEIVKYLENNRVDLVAMTTRGRSGLSRWTFGSIAEKVLAASPQPILIIKPE
jgi:nucleotide-binding universal stress UspA family protein